VSTDDKRVRDCLEQINTRVDNWARGGEYGPGGFPKDTAQKDVAFLLAHIADLEEEADRLKAASPRPVEGDGSDLPAGTVVIDNAGVAWQCDDGGLWTPAEFNQVTTDDHLEAACAPYTIVYTPTPKENAND
jgi:hypothetical protein